MTSADIQAVVSTAPASPRAALAIRILATALAFGILADALLRVGPWGLNATLYSCALAACLSVFAPRDRKRLAFLIVLFGAFFVWRDAPTLKALDTLAIGTVIVTIALPSAVQQLSRTAFVPYLSGLCDMLVGAIGGAPMLVYNEVAITGPDSSSPEAKQHWRAVATNTLIGMLIAFPLLVVFGGLFLSADAAFRDFAHDIANLEWQEFANHSLVILGVFWAVAGMLRVLALNVRANYPLQRAADALRLEPLAILIPITLLNALFLTFVCVQFEYFFGGKALVTDPSGPNYSEYAREGFFQLTAIAALALLVLYIADWLNRGSGDAARKWFRLLSALLLMLVYIVMASALHRMYLYYDAYGLTQLRFYTTAFMVWLAVVIAAFSATVLAGFRDRFVFYAISSGWAVIVAIHAINPDATIVYANAYRIDDGKTFDSEYIGKCLSADAIPALRALAEEGPERAPFEIATGYWAQSVRNTGGDWRTWSLAKRRAVQGLNIDPYAEDNRHENDRIE